MLQEEKALEAKLKEIIPEINLIFHGNEEITRNNTV